MLGYFLLYLILWVFDQAQIVFYVWNAVHPYSKESGGIGVVSPLWSIEEHNMLTSCIVDGWDNHCHGKSLFTFTVLYCNWPGYMIAANIEKWQLYVVIITFLYSFFCDNFFFFLIPVIHSFFHSFLLQGSLQEGSTA